MKKKSLSMEAQRAYAQERVGSWWRIDDPLMYGKLLYRRVEEVLEPVAQGQPVRLVTRVLHLTSVETLTGCYHCVDISTRTDSVNELREWEPVSAETVMGLVNAWQARQEDLLRGLLVVA